MAREVEDDEGRKEREDQGEEQRVGGRYKGAGRAKWWGQRTVNYAEEETGHALSRKRKQGISGSM